MDDDRSEILAALEAGEISADKAARRLASRISAAAATAPEDIELPRQWPSLWTVPVSLGDLALFSGYGLAIPGARWWSLAACLLHPEAILRGLGLASIRSTWGHIRVQSLGDSAVSEFDLSLRLLIKLAVRFIERIGGIQSRQRASVDDLIGAMEAAGLSKNPLHLEISEKAKLDRVRVYLG